MRQQLSVLADVDVQASLASVSPVTLAGQAAPAGASSPVRFRRLREHARGGLGEVSVALGEELQREVALKEIQDRFADSPDSRTRFLREAQITGNLEHPGVVPVYGLGTHADGRPFYAMRFIRGQSMQQAIGRFHKAENDPRRDGGHKPDAPARETQARRASEGDTSPTRQRGMPCPSLARRAWERSETSSRRWISRCQPAGGSASCVPPTAGGPTSGVPVRRIP